MEVGGAGGPCPVKSMKPASIESRCRVGKESKLVALDDFRGRDKFEKLIYLSSILTGFSIGCLCWVFYLFLNNNFNVDFSSLVPHFVCENLFFVYGSGSKTFHSKQKTLFIK